MQLLKPTKKYAESWWQAVLEFEAEGRNVFWDLPHTPINIDTYIKRTQENSQGINFIKFDTFFLTSPSSSDTILVDSI